MANLNKETKALLGSATDKIGTYSESTGGGDPLKKGEKFKVAETTEEAEKMREADPTTKVRVQQPRNDDGTFGYNSQNARKLKYGPSRGTTVPDFLRGVDLAFLEKGTRMVMDGPDGIKVYLSKIEMTKEQLIENCKHYIESTQGFAGLHNGMMEAKRGRRSQDEKDRVDQQRAYNKDFDELQKTKEKYGKDSAQYKKENSDFKNKYNIEQGSKGGNTVQDGGKIPSGIIISTKQYALTPGTAEYDKVEAALNGLDAKNLGRSTWGTTDYNKKAVTKDQIDERKQWRDMIKNGNIRKVTGSPTSTNTPQKEAETVPSTYGKKSNFKFSGDVSARKKAGDDILKELGIGVG